MQSRGMALLVAGGGLCGQMGLESTGPASLDPTAKYLVFAVKWTSVHIKKDSDYKQHPFSSELASN